MIIINYSTRKGGTAKTVSTIQTAVGLAQGGLRVLAIDLDPQANLTTILKKVSKPITKESLKLMREQYDQRKGTVDDVVAAKTVLHEYVSKKHFDYEISDVLESPKEVRNAIMDTPYDNLWIIPSGHRLSEADMKLKIAVQKSAERLKLAIAIVENDFDVVVIDNSPFENALTYNALEACYREGDIIVIPTKIDQGGLEGLDSTINTMLSYLEYSSLGYDFRILMTMVNRTKIDEEVVRTLKYMFGHRVFDTTIRYQTKPVTEAALKKEVLINVSKAGVAEDYKRFIEELKQII